MVSQSPTCHHHDIRKFDGFRSCLACGTTIFETQVVETSLQQNQQDQRGSDEIPSQRETYEYRRLNYELGQEIRLLIVEPGAADDPIRCDIITVNLLDEPAYEAVSYTWATEDGDASLSKVIHCTNGTTIPVTRNCEAAIRRLRKPGLRRRLWIDALCIDQYNLTERNHQVSLMKLIYEGATEVLVCLDSPYGDFSELLACLKLESKAWDRFKLDYTWHWGHTLKTIADPKHVILARRLLRLRWFHRVWVIQEVALARAVRLFVDDANIDLDGETVARLQWLYNWNLPEDDPMPGPLRLVPGTRANIDFFACMCATQHCSASDPRDKVFGILSLVGREVRALITVDYALDLSVVFTNATIAIIAQQCSLEALAYANVPSRSKHWWEDVSELWRSSKSISQEDATTDAESEHDSVTGWPSWVHDWRRTRPSVIRQLTESVHSPWQSRVLLVPSHSSVSGYRSTEQRLPSPVRYRHVSIVGDPRASLSHRLIVRAHFMDTIGDETAASDISANRYAEGSFSYWKIVARMGFESCYGKTSSIYSIPDLFYDGRSHRSLIFLKDFSQHLKAVTEIFNFSDPFSTRNSEYIYASAQRSEVFGHTKPYDAFLSAAEKAPATHCVFRTEHSLGFGRYHKGSYRNGDVVVAIDGAPAPFILRKLGEDTYSIVCDCYLMAALEYDTWKSQGGRGPWGELPDPVPEKQRTRFIDIY